MERLTKSNAYAEQGARAFVPPSDEQIKAEKPANRSPCSGSLQGLFGPPSVKKFQKLVSGSTELALLERKKRLKSILPQLR